MVCFMYEFVVGVGFMFFSSVRSLGLELLMLLMVICVLFVKIFIFFEFEKVIDNFSVKKVLGEGGFGCVY